MTLVVTILLGMGVILVFSALDGTSITETFQKVLAGGSGLDLSGTSGLGTVATDTIRPAPTSTTPPTARPPVGMGTSGGHTNPK